MTKSDVLPGDRLDLPGLDGLDERSERLRRLWRERAELTRDQLATLAAELGDELGDRAVAAREILLERYHELEDELPIEEYRHRAQLGAWQAAQAGLTGLLALPGLLVRGLGALSSVADDVAVRGADLSERGRQLAGAVPPSRAERRRIRTRTATVGVIGFVLGLVTGWVLASRQRSESRFDAYEPPLPAIWDPSSNGAEQTPAKRVEPDRAHDEAEASEPDSPADDADASTQEPGASA